MSLKLTDAEISNHKVVHLLNQRVRPGYSYPIVTRTTMLERDYREMLLRRRLSLARRSLRSNRLAMMGGKAISPHSTVQGDRIGPTGYRHISVQDTAATLHSWPKSGMHMVRVSLFGGAHVGSLIINYAENRFAHFSVPLSGGADYDLDWPFSSDNVPAADFTTDGTAPLNWTITMAEQSWGGPSISDYLSIREAVTAGGAVTVLTAIAGVAYDVGEASPLWIQAYCAHAANASLLVFPGDAGFQGGANCQDETLTYPAPFCPAPKVASAKTLILSYLAAAAGLVTAYVGYKPTISQTSRVN